MAKKTHYQGLIDRNKNDPKRLFSIVRTLLGKQPNAAFPSKTPLDELPTLFNDFFLDKVETIRASFDHSYTRDPVTSTDSTLASWDPVSIDELGQIIKSSAVKSCGLDPLPTDLLLKCLDPLLPLLLAIVNRGDANRAKEAIASAALDIQLTKPEAAIVITGDFNGASLHDALDPDLRTIRKFQHKMSQLSRSTIQQHKRCLQDHKPATHRQI
ncbi:hypothetical protein CAPTEDRAFT_213055 [Capitella teleta]|uniref:Uncharacterized protein n=1 Tax=Capitella teleta TaxID=283909 RepID=R7VJ12_CAPTE|nr:hypothetical protein CAPTEDRAFT_213055 [Capitella teleta]|eukprot:ELU16296.1 hypothetical protein CAPTEDRAFT_213055 [Capitella teleta]